MLAQGLGRSRPHRGDLREVAGAARDLVGAVRARDDRPLVPRAVDRSVGGADDLDQRALDDVEPESLEPPDERLRLRARTGDDHLHAARRSDSAISSAATRAGSPPVRRSTQLPSSAAISAVSTVAVVVRGDGREAAGTDQRHARTLGLDPPPGLGRVAVRDERLLPGPHLERERALSRLRQHQARRGAAGRSRRRGRAGRARTRQASARRALAPAPSAAACRCCPGAARPRSSGRTRAAAPSGEPTRCRFAFPARAARRRRARRADRRAPCRRPPRGRRCRSRSCPSRSVRRRRSGWPAALPRSP